MKKNNISNYIAIDLGTNNTRVFIKEHGIIFNEASIVAIDLSANNRIVGIGDSAKKLVGRTGKDIVLKFPIKDGTISDIKLVIDFINFIFKNKGYENYLKNSYMLISATSNINKTEKDGMILLSKKLGAKYCEIQDELKLAVMGMGYNAYDHNIRLIINLGAGKASAGILVSNQIINSKSIRLGGNHINEEITKFVRSFHDLIIENSNAENIKVSLGDLGEKDSYKDMLVFGRDVNTQLPKEVYVNGEKISKIIRHSYDQIASMVSEILASTQGDIIRDIYNNGIYVIGGGANIPNLKEYLHKFLNFKVNIPKNNKDIVILGGEKYEQKLVNNYNGVYNELELDKE